jgi:caib/baif family protein
LPHTAGVSENTGRQQTDNRLKSGFQTAFQMCRLLLLWADNHLRVAGRRPVAEENGFVWQLVLPAAAECPLGQRLDFTGKQQAEKLRFLYAPACFQRAAIEDFAPRIEQPFGTDDDVMRALIDDFHRLPHRLRQRGGKRGSGAQQHGSGDMGG